MSFILDALKKIERQKQEEDKAKDEGLPVMEGGRQWGGERRSLFFGLGGVGVVALIALVVAVIAFFQIVPTELSDPSLSGSEVSPEEAPASGSAPLATPESSQDELRISGSSAPRAPAPLLSTPHRDPSAGENEAAEPEPSPDDEVETLYPIRLRGRSADRESTAESEKELDESAELPDEFPELVLHGTSVVDGKAVAVINYQRLFVGDTIEGARVINISDRAVELELDGRRFTIRL